MKYRQGQLLETAEEKLRERPMREAVAYKERCMIFENFFDVDMGSSRKFVCECSTPEHAARLVEQLNEHEATKNQLQHYQTIVAMMAVSLGVSSEPHQDFWDRLLSAADGAKNAN